MSITQDLFSLSDSAYRDFHSHLMPTVDKQRVIGVRIPVLRKYAKSLYKENPDSVKSFLDALPHYYYEENNLHAFLIECVKSYPDALRLTGIFLPCIDNWATCDMFLPPVFSSHKCELLPHAFEWIKSHHTYTVRYGIGILMKLFLDESFDPCFVKTVADVRSEEYYVNMMRAWYFATALSKRQDNIMPLLESRSLDTFTHNMTIKKSIESLRIAPDTKEYLKTLRIKP